MIDVSAYLGHFAFRKLRHNTGPGLLRLMDRFAIKQAVVSSAAALAYRNPQGGNEDVAAEVEADRSRLIPFTVLNPVYAGWQDDLKTCHEQFGMKGLRLYPNWHGYKLSDPKCRELVEAATERKMVITIPVRVEDPRQRSWLANIPDVEYEDIAGLIRACPKAKFIVQNGRGYIGSALCPKDKGMPDNFAIDIGRVSVEFDDELAKLLTTLGEDRILLGTGIPFHYPGPALVKIEMLDATDAVKAKIRSGNAVRWLDLPAGK